MEEITDAMRHQFMREHYDWMIKVHSDNDGDGHYDTTILYPSDDEIDAAIRRIRAETPT